MKQLEIENAERLIDEAESATSETAAGVAMSLREQLIVYNFARDTAFAPVIPEGLHERIRGALIALETRIGLRQHLSTPPPPMPAEDAPDLSSTTPDTEIDRFVRASVAALRAPVQFCVEPSFVGIPVRITYCHGVLTDAVDARSERSILPAATQMSGIRGSVPALRQQARVNVSGTAALTRRYCSIINDARQASGAAPYPSPLDVIHHAMHSDPGKIAFIAHGLHNVPGIDTHSAALCTLRDMGFKVSENCRVVSTAREIAQIAAKIADIRYRLPYDIDGALIQINRFDQSSQIDAPAQLNFRFGEQQSWSQVIDIAALDNITLVVKFEPVMLGGTPQCQAFIHGQYEADRLDVRIGDTILVRRNSEPSPEIVRVDLSRRPAVARPFRLGAAIDARPLAGKNIAVAGALPSLSREEVFHLVTNHGGTIDDCVSKETDYLIVGDNPGEALNNAISLGIPVLDEIEFVSMVHNDNTPTTTHRMRA